VPDNPMQENPRPDPNPVYTSLGYTVTTPSFPTSGVPVQNTNDSTVNIVITGGTVSKVVVANWPATAILGGYQVAPGDTIVITYTGSPSWTWTAI
jgi:hypothetical protein